MAIIIKGQTMERENYADEAELQEKLFSCPRLLFDKEEANILFKKREVYLPNAGRVDILFIDGAAGITVVEVKLNKNLQSRREVVAQIFDYISDLTSLNYWELDEDVLDGELDESVNNADDSNDLPKKITNFLRSGTVKLVIAVDEANDDLRRIMAFISQHTDFDVRLVEVVKYDGGNYLVPSVIVKSTADDGGSGGGTRNAAPQFLEVIECYDKKSEPDCKTRGRASQYRTIRPEGFIKPDTHYEFLDGGDHIGVEYHIEKDGYSKLQERLKELQGMSINGYPFEYEPKWSRGRGRLRALIPYADGAERIAGCMKQFIKETKDKFSALIHNNAS